MNDYCIIFCGSCRHLPECIDKECFIFCNVPCSCYPCYSVDSVACYESFDDEEKEEN